MGRKRIEAKVEIIQPKWLSKEEAKKYLGCSDRFLKTLRDSAEISFSRFRGKMYWYELKSLDRFLEEHRVN